MRIKSSGGIAENAFGLKDQLQHRACSQRVVQATSTKHSNSYETA